MKNLLLLCLLGVGLLFVAGCQLGSKSPAEGWTVGIQPYTQRYCAGNQQCADVTIHLPQFRGDESATLGAFNEKIQRHLLTLVDAPDKVPVESALDSVAVIFFRNYAGFKQSNPSTTENWQMSLIASVPLLTPQITTVEAKQTSNVLANQELGLIHVITYDFRTEKYLSMSDLIPDTAAFRPILEAAFFQARQIQTPSELKQMLLPELDQLPMPRYAAVYPDGIRIVYNSIEYTFLPEIPVTDFKLSWEQLGKLADKTKWLD